MSRVISNRGLRHFSRRSGLRIGDLAYLCGATRVGIYQYSQGKKMPRLELALASNLKVTVQQLRKQLFAPVRKPASQPTRRKSHAKEAGHQRADHGVAVAERAGTDARMRRLIPRLAALRAAQDRQRAH